jgi:hypothetical protein
MFYNSLFKAAVAGVLVSVSLMTAAAPAMADVSIFSGSSGPIASDESTAIFLMMFSVLGITTTAAASAQQADTSKGLRLIDQAYEGSGDKLEILAQAAKKSVEDAAERIVALDRAGKLDPAKPVEMARMIAMALSE